MIVASGQVGHKSILDEFGRATSSNSLHQKVRFFNGKKQVLINSEWVDCNMCSTALPSHTPPHSIKDWYSYNHTATGVTGGTITGTTTVNTGTAYTYGYTLTGGNTTGTTVVWYKYENGAWSNALATASTVTITWVNPIGAKVKAIVINGCQGGSVEIEQTITYNCTNITTGSLQSVNTMEVNTIFTAYAIDSNGSPLGKTWNWTVYGNLTILAGQGTSSCVIKATAAGGTNIIEVVISNTCNSYNPGQVSLTIVGTPTVYWNTQQSKSIQRNNCSSGQTPTSYTVTVAPNTYSSTISIADANQKATDYLNSQYAQDVANNNGSCITTGGGESWGNQEQSVSFTKNDCSPNYGSVVNYVVVANVFFSTISQSDANQKAIDYANSQGQAFANANGTCTSTITYYSTERTDLFQRNNCGSGETGSFVSVTSVAGQYTSLLSVADANNIRDADMQIRANTGGATCSSSPLFWNTEISAFFQKQCSAGVGSSHYYTINANTYSATTALAAQQAAEVALQQQGQANANSIGSCTVITADGNPNFVSVNIYTQVFGIGSANPTRIQVLSSIGANKTVTASYRPFTGFNTSWITIGTVAEGGSLIIDPGSAFNIGARFETRLQFSGESVQYFRDTYVFEANV